MAAFSCMVLAFCVTCPEAEWLAVFAHPPKAGQEYGYRGCQWRSGRHEHLFQEQKTTSLVG